MSKKKRTNKTRDSTKKEPSGSFYLCDVNSYDMLCGSGYIKVSEIPEIKSAVNKIASLIASMTIHLRKNTSKGDERITNELSKKVDIYPNSWMTRATFVSWIVRTLLLEGDGNAIVFPETENGLIKNLIPIPASQISLLPNGFGYKILINGVEYDSDDVIHIPINPDPNYPWKGTGYKVPLKKIAETLNQASITKKGFMESKWKPSVIVKADGITEEFASADGRKKLLSKYVQSSEAGEPWIIPADAFDVFQVKPLSLTDLAINESVEMDKKTVASLLDIPPFVLGVGKFDKEEWNNFIDTRIKFICQTIEQGFTKALLINPDWYFRFNYRSLYSYDINTLSTVGGNMFTRGIMTGNEVRDSLGLSPKDGLDELVILENYIPQGMIGEQKKLEQKGGTDDGA